MNTDKYSIKLQSAIIAVACIGTYRVHKSS